MILAAHQPNYIPYFGYFQKMAKCDIFIYLDSVEFSKGGYGNRNKIKTPKGAEYISIPVSVSNSGTYKDVEISDCRWRVKHLKTLKANYAKAPYFSEVYELYERATLDTRFVNVTIDLIDAVADYLGINNLRLSLSGILENFGKKSQLIVDICKRMEASIYLSGLGAAEYNDEKLYSDNGIELRYIKSDVPRYEQRWGNFIPNLSVLDVLFNCGESSKGWLGI